MVPENDRILFIIFYDDENIWKIRCVNISGMPYVSRKRLPHHWLGLSGR